MKITSEKQILDINIRKQIIEEIINGPENQARRLDELRKQEIYRDKNKKWVMDQISREGFDDLTLAQISNRASNVSICRKITNKLARAYSGGVTRTVEDVKSQESINLLEDELDVTSKMKKSDRYRQLFRNTLAFPVPVKSLTESTDTDVKYDIKLRILAPWQYDVIEDPYDNEKPMVIILSDFIEQHNNVSGGNPDSIDGSNGKRDSYRSFNSQATNRTDDSIADSRNDSGMGQDRELIWWTDSYHFTTDLNGRGINQSDKEMDIDNPIKMLPFVNISADQDGFYWAEGGSDIIEGSILINKILTDINFVTFIQGWGQLVIAGKNLPKKIIGGPNRAFKFDMDDDDPTPAVFYASSNPPISDWLETLRAILALLLSTNNLSPKSISMKLEANTAPSGISLIIEESDSNSDIMDSQNLFQDEEPDIWEIIRRWHEKYHSTKSLVENLQIIDPFTDANVKLKFHQIQPPMSEKEHLENIEKRKALGMNTMVELLQKDNPDLSVEDAEKKAAKILEEKVGRQQAMIGDMFSKTESNLPTDDKDNKGDEGDDKNKDPEK